MFFSCWAGRTECQRGVTLSREDLLFTYVRPEGVTLSLPSLRGGGEQSVDDLLRPCLVGLFAEPGQVLDYDVGSELISLRSGSLGLPVDQHSLEHFHQIVHVRSSAFERGELARSLDPLTRR